MSRRKAHISTNLLEIDTYYNLIITPRHTKVGQYLYFFYVCVVRPTIPLIWIDELKSWLLPYFQCRPILLRSKGRSCHLPHGASCRGRRRCRRAPPLRCVSTEWWCWCGSSCSTAPLGETLFAVQPREEKERRKSWIGLHRLSLWMYFCILPPYWIVLEFSRAFYILIIY